MTYAIICTLDALGSRGVSGSAFFGLTVSVGVRAGTPTTDIVDTVLCPWRWSLDAVKLLVNSGQGFVSPTGAQVHLLDIHSAAKPLPGAEPDYDRLLQEMSERWTEYVKEATRFVWGAPLAEQEIASDAPAKPGARPWPLFLANASSQPYPYAQWLNLSVHLRVDWGGQPPPSNAQVIAAPELHITASGSVPADTLSLPNPTTPLVATAGTGEVVWKYSSSALDINAHCGAIEAAPKSFGVVNGNSLWVEMSGADGVFGREWRADVERAAPDVFDLSLRVLDAYRDLLTDPARSGEALEWMETIRSMVLASLADRLSSGHLPGPSGAPGLLAWWPSVLPQYATTFAAIEARLQTPPALTLDDWKEIVRAALPTPGSQRQDYESLRLPSDLRVSQPQSPVEVLGELQRLHTALREPSVIVRVLVERWKRLGVPLSPNFLAEVIQVGSATGGGAGAQANAGATMRRLLDVAEVTPMWKGVLERLTLNAESKNQRTTLRTRLTGVLRRAVFDRFGGVAPAVGGINPVSELQVATPRAATVSASLSRWLDTHVEVWSIQEASLLIPDETVVRPANAPLLAPERVPHPLSVEVGLVQPYVGDSAPADDRSDALRHFSGFGILMRRTGTSQPARWRCLNLAAAGHVTAGTDSLGQVSSRLSIDPWGKRPLLVPLRIGYHDGISEATVSYDNRPLAGLSPDALLGDHGLRDPDDATGDKPALRYVYIPPDRFPLNGLDREWSHLEALVFGRKYQLAMFVAANSGVLPTEMTASTDAPGKLQPDPAALTDPPRTAIREVWYPRRVGVGQPRLTRGDTDDQARTIEAPAIPDGIVPRVRELFGESVETSGPEGAFVLLAPPGVAGSPQPNSWEFDVRRPSTDIQTWMRWQLDGSLSQSDLVAVVKEYYTRMAHNHEPANTPQPLLLDDPCVARLAARLLEYNPITDSWTSASAQAINWVPPENATDGIAPTGLSATARTNGGRLHVTVTSAINGNARLTLVGNTLAAQVTEGRIYRLVIANDIDGADRFDPAYGVGWPDPEIRDWFRGQTVMSPWTLWIEVATSSWTVAPMSAPTMLAEIYETLNAKFTGDASDPDGRIRSESVLSLTASLDLIKYPFAHKCELEHQRWTWQGRPAQIDALKSLVRAKRTATGFVPVTEAATWDASEFGDRADDSHAVHLMDSEIRADTALASRARQESVSRTKRSRRASERRWRYDLDFTGDRGASYHRFAMLVHHRYEKVFPALSQQMQPRHAEAAMKDGNDTKRWRWHSYFVPCRPVVPLARPVVRVILPLTTRADDTPSVERSPGLLVVVKGAAFEHGGLAEQFRVQGVLAGRGTDLLYEVAPDPRDDGASLQVKPGANDMMTSIRADGPIGHSFDSEGGERRMVTATYLIAPPLLKRDMTGHFIKLKFGRAYDPALTASGLRTPEPGVVDEWSEGHWTQLLADSRIVGSGLPIKQFSLAVDGNGFVTSYKSASASKPVPTSPLAADEKRPVQALLAVTRLVMDAANNPSEAWVGLYRETTAGHWTWLGDKVDGKKVELSLGASTYFGRFLFMLRGDRNTVPDFASLTESDVWDRLFEAQQPRKTNVPEPVRLNDQVRERMQIVTVSRRIEPPVEVKAARPASQVPGRVR